MRAVRCCSIQRCSSNFISRYAASITRPTIISHPFDSIHHKRLYSTPGANKSYTLADIPSLTKSSPQTPVVLRSTTTNPYHNLSIEHFLLQNTSPDSKLLLFYTNSPCVVIGRNQNPWLECNFSKLTRGLPVLPSKQTKQDHTDKNVMIELVRRRSGGGGVFHDSGNLNYSVLTPNDKSFERKKHAEMVVRGLNGIKDEYLPEVQDVKVNERNDIVMRRHVGSESQADKNEGSKSWLKVSGSAFKLTKGRALHHGTLLYSSPYLSQISGLLKGPGAEMIHAKGVESVRSKVGNLAYTDDELTREKLRGTIMDAITTEFIKMYSPTSSSDGGDGDTADVQDIVEIQVSDGDCTQNRNPSIYDGIQELRSNSWRFEQTPKFDFKSGPLASGGMELDLHVNHGTVENLSILLSKNGHKFSVDLVAKDTDGIAQEQIKLHEVKDWRFVIEDILNRHVKGMEVKLPDELVTMLQEVFPRFWFIDRS